MRISAKLTSLLFREVLNKRDNTKGSVTEADFADWSYTTQKIIDILHAEKRMIEGYFVEDYQLWNELWDLLTPREIRLVDETLFANLKDNSGDTSDFEDKLWVDSKRSDYTYSEQLEDYFDYVEGCIEDMSDEAKKVNKVEAYERGNLETVPRSIWAERAFSPKARKAVILSPSAYVDIQKRLLKQLSKKDGQLKAISSSNYDLRTTLKTSDMSKYSIDGVTLSNPLDGFRPIALKSAMWNMVDKEEYRGQAESNFINWFRSVIE